MYLNRRNVLAGMASLIASPSFATNQQVGLIFVGASWCAVCKQAAPILALFCERQGIEVLVASADNRPIAPFPEFIPSKDNAIAAQINRYPTTLVFSVSEQRVVGLIEGYRNPSWYLSKITKNIREVLST